MKLPRAQFGQIARNYKTITDANIGVYVIFRSRSLASGYRTGVQSLLKGQASMFTNQPQLGMSSRTSFRKVLIDLDTMKVLSADPSWGRGVPLSKMIETCKNLGPDTPQ